MMRIVVALGGNALLRRGEPPRQANQQRNVERAARAIAEVARRHRVVVTHGNGPQVGLLARQAEASDALPDAGRVSLDVLDAESEGMIGYLLEQALRAQLPGRELATLLTQVEVSPDDPAFGCPTKPIGVGCDEQTARRRMAERGWQMVAERGGWRRVVPSPAPRRLLELEAIRCLDQADVLVICAGGGGIPVVREEEGRYRGVEAVVDKDHTAGLLAESLGADLLLLLTDVPCVYREWPAATGPIGRTGPGALRGLALDAGSMAPKVAAALRFAEGGGAAAIGALEDAPAIVEGRAGTWIEKGDTP